MPNVLKQTVNSFQANIFANDLIKKMEASPNKELRTIVSKKDYLNIINDVLKVINENPYASFSTIVRKLYSRKNLNNLIEQFVFDTKVTPSLVLDFGTKLTRDTVICNNENSDVNLDTLYDIASTSKLILSTSIIKSGIDLEKPIKEYCPQFINLEKTSVHDLLGFNVDLVTAGRIDEVSNFKECEEKLFSSKININPFKTNNYSDIGSMILKYVIETYFNEKFEIISKELILNPAGMNDTHIFVPEDKLHRVASNNNNKIVDENGNVINKILPLGVPQDSKAQMYFNNKKAPGHAGFFSTSDDLRKLGQAINDGHILTKKQIEYLVKNDVGRKITTENGDIVDSFNYGKLVYAKQFDSGKLGTPQNFSGLSFLSPGFTGTMFGVDYLNDITISIVSNKTNDRIWRISNEVNEYIKTDEHGAKSYMGHYICTDYVAKIKPIIKEIATLSLQYKFLEKIYKTQHQKDHLVRELKKGI